MVFPVPGLFPMCAASINSSWYRRRVLSVYCPYLGAKQVRNTWRPGAGVFILFSLTAGTLLFLVCMLSLKPLPMSIVVSCVGAFVPYLYLFFKKHRSPLSYITLRILRVLKLCLNWIFTLLALILTFGASKGYRRKMRIYSYLLLWHLKLCPEGAGLKKFRT